MQLEHASESLECHAVALVLATAPLDAQAKGAPVSTSDSRPTTTFGFTTRCLLDEGRAIVLERLHMWITGGILGERRAVGPRKWHLLRCFRLAPNSSRAPNSMATIVESTRRYQSWMWSASGGAGVEITVLSHSPLHNAYSEKRPAIVTTG